MKKENTINELKELLSEIQTTLESSINRKFNMLAIKCPFRTREWEGKDDWFRCNHKDYILRSYGITPCTNKKCPLIKRKG